MNIYCILSLTKVTKAYLGWILHRRKFGKNYAVELAVDRSFKTQPLMNISQILVCKKWHFQRHKMINIKTGQLYSQSKNILYISDFLCSTANFKRERSKHFLESLYKYIYRLFPSRLRLWSRVRYSKGSSFCSVGDINKPAVLVRGIALIQFLFSILVAITWEN